MKQIFSNLAIFTLAPIKFFFENRIGIELKINKILRFQSFFFFFISVGSHEFDEDNS